MNDTGFYGNKIFNNYAMISDTDELLSTFSVNIKKENNKNEIKLRKIKTQKNDINKPFIKEFKKDLKNSSILQKNSAYSKSKSFEKNTLTTQYENINNLTFINEKGYKYEYSEMEIFKENKNQKNSLFDKKEKEKHNLCKYIIYRISFGCIYKNIEMYENFRKKIISVENLLSCYLNINTLIEANNRKIK